MMLAPLTHTKIPFKKNETRHWATSFRGKVAIHAAQKKSDDLAASFWDIITPFPHVQAAWRKAYPVRIYDDMPFGKVIGYGDLTACIQSTEVFSKSLRLLDPVEYAFGDYTPGRYFWKFENMRVHPKGIPCRGFQQLFELPPEITEQLIAESRPVA